MRRRLAVVSAVALLGVGSTCTSAADAASGPVALGAVTMVTGSRPAAAAVSLSHRVTVSTLNDLNYVDQPDNPDIDIAGSGRLIGLVLSRASAGSANPATLVVLRYNMCHRAGCTPVPSPVDSVIGFGAGVVTDADSVTLPAGRYTLHLLTDGAAVTATLQLHGLPASRRLVRPVSPDAEHLIEGAFDPSGQHVSSDDVVRMPGDGLVVAGWVARSDVEAFPQGGFCGVKTGADPGAALDPSDAPSGCLSRVVRYSSPAPQIQTAKPFFGFRGGYGNLTGGQWPANALHLYSGHFRGSFRLTQDFVTTPLDTQHSFLVMALPYR